MENILSNDYPGYDSIISNFISPIFGESDFVVDDIYREESNSTKIKSILRIASYPVGVQDIEIFDIELKDNVNMPRSRVGIQDDIRKILHKTDAALMFFHSEDNRGDWRISFFNYDAETKSRTSAKRYTYLCGKEHSCRTAFNQFEKLRADKITKLSQVSEAFSLEAVSKEFFNQYREIYADFVQHITGKRYEKKGSKWEETEKATPDKQFKTIFNNDEKAVRDFVKKMMGRLVFLQFLQKKGWLGVPENSNWGEGNKNYLQDLFNNSKSKDDFFVKVLKPLFFETLNIDRGKNNDLIKPVLGKNQKIPYLNGGLFESDEFDKKDITFSAELFKELFEFFSHYNFTIDENDPAEKEIGVDPEMLGRIFENLLEDNKDKGAFYTPKEIVQYMCRESLIAYLITETKIKEQHIRDFVLKNTDDEIEINDLFTDDEIKVLKEKLKVVKICDPAVGSGAFPMGMMSELFHCRLALGETQSICEIKKEIVQNNIYGVDIEKGAVDIARLRFWLSIIVDEEVPIPLPNLDYKIMQGNSLVESYEGIKLDGLLSVEKGSLFIHSKESIQQLQDAITDYYRPKTKASKHQMKQHINRLVRTLIDEQGHSIKDKGLEKLKDIQIDENPYFFLWHTWFSDVFYGSLKEDGGFDIVIGNPPYIQLQNDKGILSDLYGNLNYKSFTKTGDIYQLFYEKGVELLKKNAHLCYITSNKWMRSGYGEKSRKFFAETTQPKLLIDLAGQRIFENATVDVNILLLQKAPYDNKTIAFTGDIDSLKKSWDKDAYKKNIINITFPKQDSWVILTPIEQQIKDKIEKIGTPLKDWDIQINYGIKTGCNDAFIIDGKTRDALIKESPNSANIIRPILRGKDIKRYSYEFADLYLIATFPSKHYNIDEYPAIKNHLLNFGKDDIQHLTRFGKDCWGKKRLEQSGNKGSRKKTNNKWFEMQDSIAYWEDFSSQCIAWQRITNKNQFCLTEKNMIILDSMAFISNIEKYKFYLLGILNSDLVYYWMKKNVSEYSNTGFRFSNQYVEKIPVPCYDTFAKNIETAVKKIMNKREFTNTKEINNLVFKLYNFTQEEINYIETQYEN